MFVDHEKAAALINYLALKSGIVNSSNKTFSPDDIQDWQRSGQTFSKLLNADDILEALGEPDNKLVFSILTQAYVMIQIILKKKDLGDWKTRLKLLLIIFKRSNVLIKLILLLGFFRS